MEKLRRQNLSYKVMESLRESLKKGDYKPGDVLPSIKEMAQSFGVSTSSVREAIHSLEVIGLLKVKHGSGIYVADNLADLELFSNVAALTKSKLRVIHEARLVLELGLVPLIASRVTDQDIHDLLHALQSIEESVQVTDTVNNDIHFHVRLAKCTGNSVLSDAVSNVLKSLSNDEIFAEAVTKYKDEANKGHLKIVEALQQRDSQRLLSVLKEHIELGQITHHSILG